MGLSNNGEIKSCRQCGKIFMYAGMGEVMCPACKKRDNEDFEHVKEYIYSHPQATIQETAEETDVRIRQIDTYIRENRLIIPDHSSVFVHCESCGAEIKSGRICKKCAAELSSELKDAMHINVNHIGEAPKRQTGRMHFTDSEYTNNKRR